MSKFERTINTFKNGLVSPRLRGSVVEPTDSSSAEILENFIIDRSGAAIKRPGFELVKTMTSSVTKEYHNFTLMGQEFLFSFDSSKNFNDVDASHNSQYVTIEAGSSYDIKVFSKGRQKSVPVTSWSYFGSYIRLVVAAGHELIAGDSFDVTGLTASTNPANGSWIVDSVSTTEIFFFATNVPTGTAGVSSAKIEFADDMTLWNRRGISTTTSDFVETGLETYLTTPLNIISAIKVSDRTVAFTTDKFSFLLSILDSKKGIAIERKFYLYPYFVSNVLLLQMLGKGVGDAVKCPIVPSNFPFNSVNTDTTLQVNAAIYGGSQLGAATPAGVVAKSNNSFIWDVTVPHAMNYFNGVFTSLAGRFLTIPSGDATKDVVFFLTAYQPFGFSGYAAIKVTGDTPQANATLWKLSTWGGDSHPRALGYCFGRLMYGNTPLSPSQWWASATHPDNIQYFQGFMQSNLLQDASTDFSGIKYNGVSIASISTPNARTAIADIYRFGFSDFVPNFGAINWITSRRRIHFGTDRGECQVTIGSGSYTLTSYEQNIIGTDESVLGKYTTGNRKIFYLSNNGKDIRSISTEDKDYESIDVLVSIALQGLEIIFNRIEWVEALGGLICQAYDEETDTITLYFLSFHSDTSVKAFSKIVTNKTVLGFAKNYVVLAGDGMYLTKLNLTEKYNNTLTKNCYGDIFSIAINKLNAPGAFASYYGKQVVLYHDGTSYDFTVPGTAFPVTDLPFDPDTITYPGHELFIFDDAYTAKLKTFPIHEGARFGSSIGDVQRVDRLTVLIDKSGPFQYGSEEGKLIVSEGVVEGDTKLVTVDFPQSPDREQFVYIESSDPTPLNISGISLRGVSYSGE